jgi:hypothetical protein
MALSWENLENAIRNLKEFRKFKGYADYYKIKPKNLLRINGRYYIVDKVRDYGDWMELDLRDILTNKKAYLEIDEDEVSLWHRLDKLEEKNILLKIKNGSCDLLETGNTDEYQYREYLCDGKIYALEIYPDGSNEIYKYNSVYDKKLI